MWLLLLMLDADDVFFCPLIARSESETRTCDDTK